MPEDLRYYGRDLETNTLSECEKEFMPHLALSILAIRHALLCLREILYHGHDDSRKDALFW